MNSVMRLGITIGAAVSNSFNAAVGHARAGIGAIGTTVGSVASQQTQVIGSTVVAWGQMGRAAEAVEAQQQEALARTADAHRRLAQMGAYRQLGQEALAASKAHREAQGEVERLAQAVSKGQQAQTRAAEALTRAKADTEAAAAAARQAADAQRDLERALAAGNRETEKQASALAKAREETEAAEQALAEKQARERELADAVAAGTSVTARQQQQLDRARKATADAADALATKRQHEQELASAVDQGRKATADQAAALDRAASEAKQAADALSEKKQQERALTEEVQRSTAATRSQQQELDRARQRVERTAAAVEGKKRRLTELRQEMQAAGTDTKQLASEQKRLAGELARAEQEADQAADALRRMRDQQDRRQANLDQRAELRGQMMDAVALGAAMAAPIGAAIRFESVMADVGKVTNFETPEQFKEMGRDILKLSGQIPMAAVEIGAIVEAASQSGIAREHLLEFATAAAKMGVAFDLAGGQAGQMMSNWRTGLNLSIPDTFRLGDAVNHLSNNMNATAGNIGKVMEAQGSAGIQAGLTARQTAALSAALLSSGKAPDVAATALKNLTGALTAGFAATDRQKEALSMLGFSAAEMAQWMQDDAVGAIQAVFQALANAPEVDRQSLISLIFGEESAGAIGPLLTNLDNLKQAFRLVGNEADYAGSMEREFQVRSETTENALKLLNNRINRVGVTIGSVLLPPINMLAGGLGWVADRIATVAETFPALTGTVVTVGAGLIGVKIASIGVGYAWLLMKGGADDLGRAVGAATGRLAGFNLAAAVTAARTKALAVGGAIQAFGGTLLGLARTAIPAAIGGLKALGVAALTNPIGLTITAIAGGALLLHRYWEPVSAWFGGMWRGMGEAAGPVLKGIGDALAPLAPIGRMVGEAFNGVVGWIGQLFGPVSAAEGELQAIGETGARVGVLIGNVLAGGIKLLTAPLHGILWVGGQIRDLFMTLFNYSPMGVLVSNWQPIAGFFSELFAGVVDTVGKAVNWISDRFGSIGSMVTKVGETIGWVVGTLGLGGGDDAARGDEPPKTANENRGGRWASHASARAVVVGATLAAAPMALPPLPLPINGLRLPRYPHPPWPWGSPVWCSRSPLRQCRWAHPVPSPCRPRW